MSTQLQPRHSTGVAPGSRKLIVTGIKPTGRPHVGNYVGMIKPTIDMIKARPERKHFVFVANYHALNMVETAPELEHLADDVSASMIACGLDPKETFFYRQSDIPETFELATILAAVTPKGLMNRAHAYKAAVDKNRTLAGRDDDDGINMGLYTYPILMSADILLFGGDLVPVGQDQVQHVEFARDIAGSFNRKYQTDALPMPQAIIQKSVAALPGLDGRKMSKSYGNTIPVFAEPDVLLKRITRIVTDCKRPEEPKDPESSTLFRLYRAMADRADAEEMRQRFIEGGLGYGEAKDRLFTLVDERFRGPREIFNDLMADRAELDRIIGDSVRGARDVAATRMATIRKAIGVRR